MPRRLAKDQKLSLELLRSAKPAWLPVDKGLYQQTSIVDFDSTRLEGLLKFVGRGLAWHHWKLYLSPDDEVSVMLISDMSSALFASITSG